MDYAKELEELQGSFLTTSIASLLPSADDVPRYHDNSATLSALLRERVTDLWNRDDLPPWVPEEARRYFRMPRGELGWAECCFPLQPEVVVLPRGFREFSRGDEEEKEGAGRVELLVLDGMKVVNGSPDVIPPDPGDPPPPVPPTPGCTEGERCYAFAEPGAELGQVKLHEYWSYPDRYIPGSAYCDNLNVADILMALFAFCHVTHSQLDAPLPNMGPMGEEFTFTVICKDGDVLHNVGGANRNAGNKKMRVRIRRGMRGFGWPKVMEGWVTRSRLLGWPDDDLVTKVGGAPCYYVPVSKQKVTWVCCYDNQESAILSALFGDAKEELGNSVSRVYATVKKIMHVNKSCDVLLRHGELLVALIWTLEKTEASGWTENCVWERSVDVLSAVISQLEMLFLPNYFSPDVNLLVGCTESTNVLQFLRHAIVSPSDVLSVTGDASDVTVDAHARERISSLVNAADFLKTSNIASCDESLGKICDILLGKVNQALVFSLAKAVSADASNQSLNHLKPLYEVYTRIQQVNFLCTTCAAELSFPDFLFTLGEKFVLEKQYLPDDTTDHVLLDAWRNLVSNVVDMTVLHGQIGEDKSTAPFYSSMQDVYLNIASFTSVYTTYIEHMHKISSAKKPPRRRQCFDPDPLAKFGALKADSLDGPIKSILYPAGYRRSSRDDVSIVPANPNLPYYANRMAHVQLKQFAKFGQKHRATDYQDWVFMVEGLGEQVLPLLATTNMYTGLHYSAILLDSMDIQGATQLMFDLEAYLESQKPKHSNDISDNQEQAVEAAENGSVGISDDDPSSPTTVTETFGNDADYKAAETMEQVGLDENSSYVSGGVPSDGATVRGECEGQDAAQTDKRASGASVSEEAENTEYPVEKSESNGDLESAESTCIPSGVGSGPESWVILDKPLYENDVIDATTAILAEPSEQDQVAQKEPSGKTAGDQDNAPTIDEATREAEDPLLSQTPDAAECVKVPAENHEVPGPAPGHTPPAGHGTGGRHCLLALPPHPLLSLLSSTLSRPRPSLPRAMECSSPAIPCLIHNPDLSWPRQLADVLEGATREGMEPHLAITPDNRSSLAGQMRRILALSSNDTVHLPYDMVIECIRNMCLELTAT